MTIQIVSPGAAGGIDYYVWPAGIGEYDSPVVTLSKVSATSMPVGTSIAPTVRDISGDSAWTPSTGLVYYPQAVVTTAAISGDITVSAKKTRYLTVPAFPPLRFVFVKPDKDILPVTKPTAERWFLLTQIYAYVSGAATFYTNLLATATGGSSCWIAGLCTANRPIGSTDGYIGVACFIASGPPNDFSQSANGLTSIAVATTGGVPQIAGSLYCSPDKSLVSSSVNATTPIRLGTCVFQDKTVSPPIFKYYPGDVASTANNSFQRVSESSGCLSKSFATLYRSSDLVLLSQQKTIDGDASGIGDRIIAPILRPTVTSAYRGPALAYDPILPSPYDDLRIVWVNNGNAAGELRPILCRRTTVTAPASGMVRTGREVNGVENFSSVNDITGSEYKFQSCDFAHGQSYEFGSIPRLQGASLSLVVKRAEFVPAGIVQFDFGVYAAGMTCVWGIREPFSGAFTAIPGYPAVTCTAGTLANTWYATMPAPAPTYIDSDSIGQFCIIGTPTAGSPVPVSGAMVVTSLKDTIDVYPFDVVRCSTLSDSGGTWVGNYGWRFGALPLPVITWGSPPAAAFNAGTGIVTLSGFSTAAFSVPAGKGVLTAYSGAISLANIYVVGYRTDWIGLPADLQPTTRGLTNIINTVTSGPVTFSAGFRPVTGATTLRVIFYVQNILKHPYALGEIKEYIIDIAVP